MKEYLAPEFETIKYDVEDCLTGSQTVPFEEEEIGNIIDDLFGN